MGRLLIKLFKNIYAEQSRNTPLYFFTHLFGYRLTFTGQRRFASTLFRSAQLFGFEIFLITLVLTLSQPLFSAENKDGSYTATTIDNKFIISKASLENTLIIQDAKICSGQVKLDSKI